MRRFVLTMLLLTTLLTLAIAQDAIDAPATLTPEWRVRVGAEDDSVFGRDIVFDGEGAPYIVGRKAGTGTIDGVDGNYSTPLIMKVTPDGEIAWNAEDDGGYFDDTANFVQGLAIDADHADEVRIAVPDWG